MSTIHEYLAARWSPRAFAAAPVEHDQLRTLFEAARWAPSCYNDQPWRFVLARRGRDEAYGKLLQCLVPANQAWAATAPILILVVAAKTFRHNGQSNRYAWYDAGQAVANLLCQATVLGLMAHQMAGFDPVRAHADLGLPDAFDAVAVMALGYHGEPSMLPAGVAEKLPEQRERLPLSAIVFAGGWGRPFGDI